jgi:hypothetical protein
MNTQFPIKPSNSPNNFQQAPETENKKDKEQEIQNVFKNKEATTNTDKKPKKHLKDRLLTPFKKKSVKTQQHQVNPESKHEIIYKPNYILRIHEDIVSLWIQKYIKNDRDASALACTSKQMHKWSMPALERRQINFLDNLILNIENAFTSNELEEEYDIKNNLNITNAKNEMGQNKILQMMNELAKLYENDRIVQKTDGGVVDRLIRDCQKFKIYENRALFKFLLKKNKIPTISDNLGSNFKDYLKAHLDLVKEKGISPKELDVRINEDLDEQNAKLLADSLKDNNSVKDLFVMCKRFNKTTIGILADSFKNKSNYHLRITTEDLFVSIYNRNQVKKKDEIYYKISFNGSIDFITELIVDHIHNNKYPGTLNIDVDEWDLESIKTIMNALNENPVKRVLFSSRKRGEELSESLSNLAHDYKFDKNLMALYKK